MISFIRGTVLAIILSAVTASPGSQWSENLASSKDAARKEGKQIFLYIFNDTSVDSRLVIKNSLSDAEVNKHLSAGFILARCNIDTSSWFLPLVKDVGLYRFKLPLIMVIDPDKGIRSWHEGYITPDSLAWYLASARGLKPPKKSGGSGDNALFAEAKKAYDKKDWDKAARTFNGISEERLSADKRWKLNFYLGVLYYVNGDYDAAIARYRHANELKPAPDIWYNMACAFAMKSDVSSALFCLDKALGAGYKDISSLRSDSDLKSIQGPGLDNLILKYTTEEVRKVKAPADTQQPLKMSPMESKCYDLVNVMRKEKGLKPLVFASDLLAVARKHSEDMGDRNFFEHVNPDGKSPFDRIKAAGIGYDYAAENIQYSQGFDDPASVAADGWRNSPGHYHNIITPELSESAIGSAVMPDGRVYFTQVFIRRQ
jgi:uncharacterized protein YkwD